MACLSVFAASRAAVARPFAASSSCSRGAGGMAGSGQRASLLGNSSNARWVSVASAASSSSTTTTTTNGNGNGNTPRRGVAGNGFFLSPARGRPRTFMVEAGKKGFAELLGNLSQPKEEHDFQGRPRLSKGKVSAKRHVPDSIPRPPYAERGFLPDMNERPQVHDAEGIEKMRVSGLLAAQVLDYAESIIKPGVTTDFIDQKVHKMIIDNGAYPSPLNYGGFPKSVCTSVNECICHGIPDTTELMEGDIINVDVTVYLNGYHGDTSRTICVGKVSDEVRRLVDVTERCLQAAIDVCKPGTPVRKIGATIHALADKEGFGVVEKFVGHGVGQEFHSGPTVRMRTRLMPRRRFFF